MSYSFERSVKWNSRVVIQVCPNHPVYYRINNALVGGPSSFSILFPVFFSMPSPIADSNCAQIYVIILLLLLLYT